MSDDNKLEKPQSPQIHRWYEHGDIVLITEDGGIEHHFRVHAAILGISSPVFRDMLAVPPPAEQEELEGCSVVRLHDSAEDLDALMSALFDGLSMHGDDRLTFDILLRILRMSTKYQMAELRGGIIRLLQEDWPINHSDYITRQTFRGSSQPRFIQSIKLIRAARECGVPELLPTPFYELAATRVYDWNDEEYAAVQNQLLQDDINRFFIGRERSSQRLRKLIAGSAIFDSGKRLEIPNRGILLLHDSAGKSISPSSHRRESRMCMGLDEWCLGMQQCLRVIIGDPILAGESPYSVLDNKQGADWSKIKAKCNDCIQWFNAVMDEKQREIWENVTVDFDLPRIDPKLYEETIFMHK